MTSSDWRPLALAGCLLLLASACGDPVQSSGGTGGVGGVGGAGGAPSDCTNESANACIDLLNCCRAILVNPVFFESCNAVVLQCDEMRCVEVLEGYVQCRDLEL